MPQEFKVVLVARGQQVSENQVHREVMDHQVLRVPLVQEVPPVQLVPPEPPGRLVQLVLLAEPAFRVQLVQLETMVD